MNRKWDGKLMDANGRQGTVGIEILDKEEGKAVWSVSLYERDGQPIEIKGEIEVQIKGDRMQGGGVQKVNEKQEVEWEFDLSVGKAGIYAQQAMVGQYIVKGDMDNMILSRGVMILWQFE